MDFMDGKWHLVAVGIGLGIVTALNFWGILPGEMAAMIAAFLTGHGSGTATNKGLQKS